MNNKDNKQRKKAELLGGFRDYLPELMILRQEIMAIIKKTFLPSGLYFA